MNTKEEDALVVHALWGGFALCGFADTVPMNWPDGHVWVPPCRLEDITCAPCKQEAQKDPERFRQR